MSESESTRSGEQSRAAVARWDEIGPTNVRPLYLTGDCLERAELAAGLRAVADLIEQRPELPIPSVANRELQVYATGTNEEMCTQVDYAGRLLGVPVTGDLLKGQIYKAEKSFGRFGYGFSAVRASEEEPAAFTVGQEVAEKTAAGVAAGDAPQPAARAAAAADRAEALISGPPAVPQPRHGSNRKA
jgi:hypothetical protein